MKIKKITNFGYFEIFLIIFASETRTIMYEQYLSMPAVPAGAILKRILQKEGISQKEIAEKSSIYPQRINELVRGKRKFTPEMSVRLGNALGIVPGGYFYTIQANHDIHQYQDEQERKITPDLSKIHKVLFWDSVFDKINWLRDEKWIIQRAFEYGRPEEIEEIMRFYGKENVTNALNNITDKWHEQRRIKNRKIYNV